MNSPDHAADPISQGTPTRSQFHDANPDDEASWRISAIAEVTECLSEGLYQLAVDVMTQIIYRTAEDAIFAMSAAGPIPENRRDMLAQVLNQVKTTSSDSWDFE